MSSLRARLEDAVRAAVGRLVHEGDLPADAAGAPVRLAPPKAVEMGDVACQLPLRLARLAGRPGREIAARLGAAVGDAGGLVARHEVAGGGYLNFFYAPAAVASTVCEIARLGADFLRFLGAPRGRVLVEFVSANPTGPLHVAHGRGAVMGDVVARLLAARGWEVSREYYVNDQGRQIEILAQSVWRRYLEALGYAVDFPADLYPGDYITEMARAMVAEVGDRLAPEGPLAAGEPPPPPPEVAERAVAAMMRRVRADLADFGVRFDAFVSERALCRRLDVAAMIAGLRGSGPESLVYENAGRLWFRATHFRDDKDRVLVREDGRPTYFAGDVVYHHDKMLRGFDRLINVWGADHGGYVARVRGGLAAFGHDPERLEILLVQMISVSRDGSQVRMGKRLGTAVWLKDLVDEVGADAVRYLFLRQRADAQMDFDVDLAKRQSLDNPVFYAQMGHARLAAIARRAALLGIESRPATPEMLTALTLPEERQLLVTLGRAPDVVEDAAEAREPHHLASYVQELIAQFHSYYTRHKSTARIVGDPDAPATHARLAMCRALKDVIAALLDLLGVGAPERMHLPEDPA